MDIIKQLKRIARKARRYHTRHKHMPPACFTPVDHSNKGHALVSSGYYRD